MPRVNPSHHPYARARARQWSARCYGVARQRDRSRQKAPGSPACFLSAISGWFSLSLYPLGGERSEEHTSELQSHLNLVCRLLLEKKKNISDSNVTRTTTLHDAYDAPIARVTAP